MAGRGYSHNTCIVVFQCDQVDRRSWGGGEGTGDVKDADTVRRMLSAVRSPVGVVTDGDWGERRAAWEVEGAAGRERKRCRMKHECRWVGRVGQLFSRPRQALPPPGRNRALCQTATWKTGIVSAKALVACRR